MTPTQFSLSNEGEEIIHQNLVNPHSPPSNENLFRTYTIHTAHGDPALLRQRL